MGKRTKIAELDERVTIITPAYTQDATGQVLPNYDTPAASVEVWGRVRYVSGSEKVEAAQVVATDELEVIVRYREIDKDQVLELSDGEIYDITASGDLNHYQEDIQRKKLTRIRIKKRDRG